MRNAAVVAKKGRASAQSACKLGERQRMPVHMLCDLHTALLLGFTGYERMVGLRIIRRTLEGDHDDAPSPRSSAPCSRLHSSGVSWWAAPARCTVSGMAQPYPMPAHCKLTGRMHERTGSDGKPYAIGFEMRLPAQWNGRFLLQANGGNDGVVQPAFGNVVDRKSVV